MRHVGGRDIVEVVEGGAARTALASAVVQGVDQGRKKRQPPSISPAHEDVERTDI